MKISIASPQIGKAEIEAVSKVLKSGKLAQGEKVKEFEEKFARFIGVKYAVATSSGTTALEVVLRAHQIGPGDEVITTPFTFIASSNAILYTGAKPVFVDIDESFNIDPVKIEAAITKKTKAILPVHLYGNPANMTKILSIARKHKLRVIEDACQAHGATYKGRKVGSFGSGVFSFYPTKNMTTAEGGMITTNSREIYELARLLRSHGAKAKYQHEVLGYNYRMSDIGAAIGIEQLKKLPKFNECRIKNAQFLNRQLGNIAGIIVPKLDKDCQHVYHQYTIRVTDAFPLSRKQLIKKLLKKNIETAIHYPLTIPQQSLYQHLGFSTNFPVAKRMANEVLSLPIHPALTKKELNYITSQFLL